MSPAEPHAPERPIGILDVRPSADFFIRHRRGATNIPLEELNGRMHELPPPHDPLIIYDLDCGRATAAAERLRESDRSVASVIHGADWLAKGAVDSGPATHRLWRPHALLEEALAFSRSQRSVPGDRRALDVACGSGRDAVALAMDGFAVEACDNLPDAIAICADLARRNRVRVETRVMDLVKDAAIPASTYSLICCFNFLHRPLIPLLAEAVRPGGLMVYETFVHPQRELFGKPSREAHVLKPGELAEFFQDWEVQICREGLVSPKRIAASLIARRPG